MRTDLEIIRGDTLEIAADLSDENGQPVDDETATFHLYIKTNRGDPDSSALIHAQASQAAPGVAQFGVSAADVTSKLTGPSYFYAVRVEETDHQVTTLGHGLLTVRGG